MSVADLDMALEGRRNKGDFAQFGRPSRKNVAGKKRGPPDCSRALVIVKVKNLQRGTADAAELGGKAAVCISCVRYDAFMGRLQLFFVQDRHAFCASLGRAVIFLAQDCLRTQVTRRYDKVAHHLVLVDLLRPQRSVRNSSFGPLPR